MPGRGLPGTRARRRQSREGCTAFEWRGWFALEWGCQRRFRHRGTGSAGRAFLRPGPWRLRVLVWPKEWAGCETCMRLPSVAEGRQSACSRSAPSPNRALRCGAASTCRPINRSGFRPEMRLRNSNGIGPWHDLSWGAGKKHNGLGNGALQFLDHPWVLSSVTKLPPTKTSVAALALNVVERGPATPCPKGRLPGRPARPRRFGARSGICGQANQAKSWRLGLSLLAPKIIRRNI